MHGHLCILQFLRKCKVCIVKAISWYLYFHFEFSLSHVTQFVCIEMLILNVHQVIFTNESNIDRWKNKRQDAVDSKIGRLNSFIKRVGVPIQVKCALVFLN